jgi:hypothetical protein
MSANTQPIFTSVPNVSQTGIGTTSAQVKSDGTCAGSGTDLMYCVFVAGANGSFLQKIRFNPVASAAATSSVATTLRVYMSSVTGVTGSAVGATTNANTYLLAEISVPIISASNSTNAANYYEIPFNIPVPVNMYIHVSQHIAQTTNQRWNATAFGGNY